MLESWLVTHLEGDFNLGHYLTGRETERIVVTGMNVVIEVLLSKLNHHRKHLDDATITLIDQLMEKGEEPDESQKRVLYQADRKLRRDIGDQEFFRRAPSSN